MSIFNRIRRLFGGRPADTPETDPGDAGASEEMISCMDAITFMQEYLDGELPRATADKVQAHFEACARCYPHLRMEESFRTAVRRAARGQSAPPELKDRVTELLAEASTE